MKSKTILALVFCLVALLVVSAVHAQAVSVDIDEVKIDGTEVCSVESCADGNRLAIERGTDFEVKIRVSADEDVNDVEIMAFIGGYEHSDVESISDTTSVFDMEANVTYTKTLKLTLPPRVEEDDYKLRVIVADRNGDLTVENFRLKVDVPRHDVTIRDVIFNPDGSIQAGRALLATVRIKNTGEQTEDSIKVKVEIPSLGVSASDFVDELDSEDTTSSEELFLRIPVCAQPGSYQAIVSVEFNDGDDSIKTTKTIQITEGDVCPIKAEMEGKVTITVSGETQQITAGGAGAAYPVAITNSGTSAKTFVLSADGVSTWGTVRISPSNVVNVAGGETKTVFVFVTANAGTASGERMFAVTVSDVAGNSLQDISLKANVAGSSAAGASTISAANAKRVLEIGLIVLVVVLVIVGLVIAFRRMKGGEGEEGSQTYY
ncbi:MAG: hypothetical protein V1702_06305 [Candidatus Woesearchaeota archaeon]